ncbi:MAG: DoxX family protein [Bacteroidetes bacterium]|nr:DoxX family protein [Bacteroidota bacterium]
MKKTSLIIMSLLYILAGINHFVHPDFYLKIMPPYIPFHRAMVVLSGICEFVFGALLLFRQTRKFAGLLIILMLVAFMTVHVQMIIDAYPTLWLAVVRFAFQFVLIWWANSVRNFKGNIFYS